MYLGRQRQSGMESCVKKVLRWCSNNTYLNLFDNILYPVSTALSCSTLFLVFVLQVVEINLNLSLLSNATEKHLEK